jgi:hypothetical protein
LGLGVSAVEANAISGPGLPQEVIVSSFDSEPFS